MKKLFPLAVATAFLFAASALAQSAGKTDESKPTSKTTVVSGKVSDDATAITDDKNVRWTITNPVVVQPFAGEMATVKGHPYKGENKILVISASGVLPDAKVVGNRDTSAFRR